MTEALETHETNVVQSLHILPYAEGDSNYKQRLIFTALAPHLVVRCILLDGEFPQNHHHV